MNLFETKEYEKEKNKFFFLDEFKNSELLLDRGYEVFLFTDYNYRNSNECYKKLGYEDGGYLINYCLKRK